MFIVRLSGGEYSDYWEHWYSSEKSISHKELAQLIKTHYMTVKRDHERKYQHLRKLQYDECEQLFGTRESPYYGEFTGKRGTYEQFLIWRAKYDELFRPLNFDTMLMAACGLQPLVVDLEIDIGQNRYLEFLDSEEFDKFISDLEG